MHDTNLVEYNVTDSKLNELEREYKNLTCSIEDRNSVKAVTAAIGTLRQLRTSVEVKRKELKADALEWGRKVDAEAKRITGRLLSLEEPLKEQKQLVDAEKQRLKEEQMKAEQERLKRIRIKIDGLNPALSLIGCRSDVIEDALQELRLVEITSEEFEDCMAEAQVKLRQGLKDVEQLLFKTLQQEAHERQLRQIQEKQKREKAELEEQLRKEKEEKERLQAEQDRILEEEREKARKEQAERDRLNAEIRAKEQAERDKQLAKERAEAQAQQEELKRLQEIERKKDEERRLKEAEALALAQAPDKEQLRAFVTNIFDPFIVTVIEQFPVTKTLDTKFLRSQTLTQLEIIRDAINKKAV